MSYQAPDSHHRPPGGDFDVPPHPPYPPAGDYVYGAPAYGAPVPGAPVQGAYLPGMPHAGGVVPSRHVPYGDLRTVWRYHAPRPPAPHVMPLTPADQKMWGMFAHLGSLLLGWIAPLIIMVTFGERSEWVRANSREALNFSFTLMIGIGVSYALSLVMIGIPLLLACIVMAYVFPIIAAVKANRGEFYHYPVAIPFFRR